MKKIFFTLLLTAMVSAISARQIQMIPAQATARQTSTTEELSMEFGYCGELEKTIGWGAAGTVRAVIEIPAEIATKYQGTKITKLLAGLGNDAGFDSKVIIMNSLDDTELAYSQDATFKANEWNEIELTTPYTLDGKAFYIGYELTISSSKSYPVGVDAENAVPQGDLCAMYDTASEKWVWEHLAEYGFGNNCIKVILTGDNLPRYDLAFDGVTIKEYVRTGEPFSIVGTVENLAALDINTFDITYQIGDAEPVVCTINTTVARTSTAKFSIDNIVIAEDGEYEVKLEISSIEGHSDENPANNTYAKTINSMSNLVARKVLIEEFSTTQCGNCPRAHTMMKEITEGRDDIALVIHHAGYGQDNYTITASRNYLNFYNGSTYAPAMMIDRRNLGEQGAQGYVGSEIGAAPGPVFMVGTQDEVEDLINYCFDQPAFITVNIEDSYNEETRELTVRVYGETVIDFEVAPYINIFLTESGMVNYQNGGGNNYVHNHAIRATMTSTWGDELTFTDKKYDVTYTYKLNDKWLPENMSIIAFVAKYDSQNVNNCEVYNTDWKNTEYGAGVDNITNDNCNVWAANGHIYLNGSYETAEIFSLDGRLVKQIENTTSVEMENAGIYLVRVDNRTFKVIVK